MSIKNALSFCLLISFVTVSCAKEEKSVEIEDKQLQKEWELVSFYDKEAEEFIEYPKNMDKIWIQFTEDSVFMHSFCPTVGSKYQAQEDSILSVGGFIMQEEYCQLYEAPPFWDHDLANSLAKATHYQVTEGELRISTEGKYDLYFTEKRD